MLSSFIVMMMMIGKKMIGIMMIGKRVIGKIDLISCLIDMVFN